MHKTIRFTFVTGFLLLLALSPCSLAQTREIDVLIKKLEETLNSKNKTAFYKLISIDIASDLEKKYDQFLKKFPNAKWKIKTSKRLNQTNQLIEVITTAQKAEGNHNYSLVSNQKLAIYSENGVIKKQKVISDYSILNSNTEQLEISIGIPDVVLTGSNYDIDIIIEKPLKERILAGGLILLNPQSINKKSAETMELSAMGSGGLFKSVRAPFKPGKQRWGALIAHPQGIVSITKTVRIVSDLNDPIY